MASRGASERGLCRVCRRACWPPAARIGRQPMMNGWLLLFWVAGGMLALLVIVMTFYRQLLPLTAPIDRMNDWFGVIANWLVLLAAVVSAANASIRYVLS